MKDVDRPLSELLPHAAPMILLDRVLECEVDRRVVCEVTPSRESVFAEQDGVSAVVGLEYMAQAAGVLMGFSAYARGASVSAGMLIGARELELHVDTFRFGETLRVEAERLFDDGRLASLQCVVRHADRVLAGGSLNVLKVEKSAADAVGESPEV